MLIMYWQIKINSFYRFFIAKYFFWRKRKLFRRKWENLVFISFMITPQFSKGKNTRLLLSHLEYWWIQLKRIYLKSKISSDKKQMYIMLNILTMNIQGMFCDQEYIQWRKRESDK